MKPVVWLIGGTSESRNLIKFMAELDIILYFLWQLIMVQV